MPPFLISPAVKIGLALALLTALFLYGVKTGYSLAEGEWQRAALAAAQRTIRIVTQQQVITHDVVTKFVEVQGKTKTVFKTLEKEVPVYVKVPTFIPSGSVESIPCPVPVGFVRLWNAANTLSHAGPAPAGADDAPSGLTLADVASHHLAEADVAHATAQQLTALQEWLRRQHALSSEPAP